MFQIHDTSFEIFVASNFQIIIILIWCHLHPDQGDKLNLFW